MDSFSGYGGCSIPPDIIEMLKTKSRKIKRPKYIPKETDDQRKERAIDTWACEFLDEIKKRDSLQN